MKVFVSIANNNILHSFEGFKRSGNLFEIERCSKDCGVLRVAHPTINVLQLYANKDICINKRCGLDIFYIQYIASNLHVETK